MRQLDRARPKQTRSSHDDENSEFTWDTPVALAGRLEVPVTDAWRRLQVGPKRRAVLEAAVPSFEPGNAPIVGIVGPPRSAKTSSALGCADHRNLRAVYATEGKDQQAFKPSADVMIVIDPVSAFDLESVRACVEYYRGVSPIVLIDRDEARLSEIPGVTSVVRLKMPSPKAISEYLVELLRSYPNSLTPQDYGDLGVRMHGLSLFQVNQIAIDAALARLMYNHQIDRSAFESAIEIQGTAREAHLAAAPATSGRRRR